MLSLLNCSSICVTLFCVPLFTFAALCDGIRLILTISFALQTESMRIFNQCGFDWCEIRWLFTYIIVTSASGVFNGRPLRNARDITIFDAFASLIVPWKMPISSMHLIETDFPTQFSLIFFGNANLFVGDSISLCDSIQFAAIISQFQMDLMTIYVVEMFSFTQNCESVKTCLLCFPKNAINVNLFFFLQFNDTQWNVCHAIWHELFRRFFILT